MKITKRELKTLILEFMKPNALQQGSNLSSLPMMVNSIGNTMIKNNKIIIEKMVNSLSEEDKSAIVEFKNLGISQQIEAIKTSLSSQINESNREDNPDAWNKAIQRQVSQAASNLDSGSLYDLLRGNPKGIEHVAQLEKLSDEEINDLWNSTFHAKGIYQFLIPISLTGSGVVTMVLPDIVRELSKGLNKTLNILGYIDPISISVPYYGEAAFTLMLLGMIFAFHAMVVNQVRDSTIYKQGDRQAKEREISDYLYLDDKDMPLPGSRKVATTGQNIKMMIKNVFRFFTQ